MNTKDMIQTVRINVAKARTEKRKDYIDGRIEWSRESSQKSWLTRWAWGLPDHEYTPEEAEASYSKDWMSLDTIVNWTGADVIKICNALETALANGLPLKLTAAEVCELRKWL